MLRTSVPKAPVYKNGDPGSYKNNVRSDGRIGCADRAIDSVSKTEAVEFAAQS